MSKRTIAKFLAFVILFAAACCFISACSSASSEKIKEPKSSDYISPQIVGKIANPDVKEASGIAASKCQPDVFWTHNDSGDDAFIFAINSKGDNLGTWKVTGARNNDWEDIAAFKDSSGKCYVYIGEIGDNEEKRPEHAVYRVIEPTISPESSKSDRNEPLPTDTAEVLRFSYPDSDHNAEVLLVHPKSGEIYILTKRLDGPSAVFKLKPAWTNTSMESAEKIADIKVPSIPNGLLTGGDISPDGRRVILCDYVDGYELQLPDGDGNFDNIWKQMPIRIDLGKRKGGEAVTYSADGKDIYATTEGKNAPVILVRHK